MITKSSEATVAIKLDLALSEVALRQFLENYNLFSFFFYKTLHL